MPPTTTAPAFLGLNLQTWLGLTVFGAIISTAGALFGIILKDFVFARSLEKWKQRQTLAQIYQKFRDPIVMASRELASRTLEIVEDFPTGYLSTEVLNSKPSKQMNNSATDPYFRKYKLISTAYRLSAFLGWLELYRHEIVFLHPGNSKGTKEVLDALDKIRGDLADGQLNEAGDFLTWRDTLIFREELRSIGESMIEAHGEHSAIIGYGKYCAQVDSKEKSPVRNASRVVLNFYLDFCDDGKDFRLVRLQLMFVHLIDLIRLIDPSFEVPEHLENGYNTTSKSVASRLATLR